MLFAASTAAASGGQLFVRISPGFTVLVDGAESGVSTAEQGGAIITNLAPGQHGIVVRAADGRQGRFSVSIVEGQMTTIDVSPLGLRKTRSRPAEDESGVVRIVSLPRDCVVQLRGESQKNAAGDELDFDPVPPGRHSLVVTQGPKSLRADIDVPAASIVTVQPDFKAGTLRTTDTHRKPRRLQLSDANDALTPLLIPAYWKSAIRGALPSGVAIVSAAPVTDNGVKVSMRVPSNEVGVSLIEGMLRSTAFAKISASDAPRKEQNGWSVDFIFYFPQ